MALTPDASFYQAADAILARLGAPRTITAVNLVVAWSYCEKPHYPGGAWQWNNPLNTTEPGYGRVGTANSAGVGIYATPADGVAATVATLTNGHYPTLVQALRTSNAGLFFSASGSADMRVWGTDMGCIAQTYQSLGPVPSGVLPASGGAAPAGCPTGYRLVNGACVPIVTAPRVAPVLLGAALAGAGLIGLGLTLEALADPAWVRAEWARLREAVRARASGATLRAR
jgi:hypothetical protein